ncbi:uncharacterized protein LOC129913459 [Episyrphus balteatus]|uniref:uncharacterized protein LOC129913459 n=1 Tax=Episyrphus balteatus TaxID=286459 RepID=UPI0024850E27|nr:uncharacterized protein LOC129913459 [Episyrphus balteatus]
MNLLVQILCVGLIALKFVNAVPVVNDDTYLQALQNSQHPSELYGPPPGYNYEPQIQQPQQEYGPPQQVYGPPQPEYGPPPQPQYGPPPHAEYGPPPQTEYIHHPPAIYHEYPKQQAIGMAHQQVSIPEWLLGKLKLKLNLFTLGKILLKLIIFKKIVKFIGVICLLLFLPKLGNMFKMDEPAESDSEGDASVEMRNLKTDRDYFNERLEESARQVLKSLENFTKRYGSESSSS